MAAAADTRDAGPPDPDQELVDRARRGDQDAIRLLVERHQTRVIGLAWGLLGNRSDAEDAAQDAFVRAFRGLRTFRGQSRFRTWLFQIAINAARTFRSRREGRREVSAGGSADFDSRPAPGQFEAAAIAHDQLRQAMATLPPEMREAVVLRDVNGLDYREIADLLAVPIGTVESRIFRGRTRLREALTAAAAVGGVSGEGATR